MEWFGEKMLPRGLTNLAYQVVPGWLSKRLKIVAHPRVQERRVIGEISYIQNGYFRINIYPTVILYYWRRIGVLSYYYWHDFLRVLLHEIGHAMTYDKRRHINNIQYWENSNAHFYVEQLADNWCNLTMDKIGRRHPRLGQPEGWIGGLPGIYISKSIENSKANKNDYVHLKVENYRAYKCGGQLSLSDVFKEILSKYKLTYSNKNIIKVKKIIKKVSLSLGINRHYVDRAGRQHLFFNYGESELIIKQVCSWFENGGNHELQELTSRDINQNGYEFVSDEPLPF